MGYPKLIRLLDFSAPSSAIRDLLSQGSNPDERDDRGCTALHHAAVRGRADACRALLEAGADPNARDDDTETVLMWACSDEATAELVRLLVAAGADVHARSDVDGTALRWAVKYSPAEVVEELLATGADPDAPFITECARRRDDPAILRLIEQARYGRRTG